MLKIVFDQNGFSSKMSKKVVLETVIKFPEIGCLCSRYSFFMKDDVKKSPIISSRLDEDMADLYVSQKLVWIDTLNILIIPEVHITKDIWILFSEHLNREYKNYHSDSMWFFRYCEKAIGWTNLIDICCAVAKYDTKILLDLPESIVHEMFLFAYRTNLEWKKLKDAKFHISQNFLGFHLSVDLSGDQFGTPTTFGECCCFKYDLSVRKIFFEDLVREMNISPDIRNKIVNDEEPIKQLWSMINLIPEKFFLKFE